AAKGTQSTPIASRRPRTGAVCRSRKITWSASSGSTTATMTQLRPEISIVVPVYRSENTLPHLAEQVSKAMDAAGLAGRFRLVLLTDASPAWRCEGIQY